MASPRVRYTILLVLIFFTIFFLGLRTDSAREQVLVLGENAWEAVVTGVEKGKGLLDHGIAAATSTSQPSATATEVAPVVETKKAAEKTQGDDTAAQLPLQQQYETEYSGLRNVGSIDEIYGATIDKLEDVDLEYVRYPESISKTSLKAPYSSVTPMKYDPYPIYDSPLWKDRHKGLYSKCDTPWDGQDSSDDLMVFLGRPKGFPQPSFGAYDIFDIDDHLCFERQTRYGPYGYREKAAKQSESIDWDQVKWGELSVNCILGNIERFDMKARGKIYNISVEGEKNLVRDTPSRLRKRGDNPAAPRTAVVVRVDSGRKYSEDDKQHLRSLINELTLKTGGEYQVFMLVYLEDNKPIWKDETAYDEALRKAVPAEFVGISMLWNNEILEKMYPQVNATIFSLRQSEWMALQRFSQIHASFDYYWNWNIDTRYTGNYYDLLSKIHTFANKQPRKYLWERSDRFYIPSIHGPYTTGYRTWLASKFDYGKTVWGAPNLTEITPTVKEIEAVGPKPPKQNARDDWYHWGRGDEADFVSLSPIFDPQDTTWQGKDDIWGYESGTELPRRATILTDSRISKKLLDLLDAENEKGNHLHNQMFPQTVAMLHSLKALNVPHPVFLDRSLPAESLIKFFNPGKEGQIGHHPESPYSSGREKRLSRSTYHQDAEVPKRLYNHWMGREDGGLGGPEWEKIHGRTCLPPMLLHPAQ